MLTVRILIFAILANVSISYAADIHLDIDELKESAAIDLQRSLKIEFTQVDSAFLVEMAEIKGNVATDHSMLLVTFKTPKSPLPQTQWAYAYGLNGKKAAFLVTVQSDSLKALYSPLIVATFAERTTAEAIDRAIAETKLLPEVKTVTLHINPTTKVSELIIEPKVAGDAFALMHALSTNTRFSEFSYQNPFEGRILSAMQTKELLGAEIVLSERTLDLRQKNIDKVFTTDIHLAAPFSLNNRGTPFHKEYIAQVTERQTFDELRDQLLLNDRVYIREEHRRMGIIRYVVKSEEADRKLNLNSKIDATLINDRAEEVFGQSCRSIFD